LRVNLRSFLSMLLITDLLFPLSEHTVSHMTNTNLQTINHMSKAVAR